MKHRSTAERKSDTELVVTRSIDAPARIVFEAWTRAELFQRWWVPKSAGLRLLSCDMDVRVGGTYRLVFDAEPEPIAFHGSYLEVTAPTRLSWTNEEVFGSGQVSTVSFEEIAGKTAGQTWVVVHERYPSKAALDDAIHSGSTSGDMNETFDQLDELLAAHG